MSFTFLLRIDYFESIAREIELNVGRHCTVEIITLLRFAIASSIVARSDAQDPGRPLPRSDQPEASPKELALGWKLSEKHCGKTEHLTVPTASCNGGDGQFWDRPPASQGGLEGVVTHLGTRRKNDPDRIFAIDAQRNCIQAPLVE